eukprot:GCRY01001880.1.p1 GENE.GCRY01001880.1~~GCRY01001880.1.p1  ORF type:complete len:153 (-),score=19.73 GCRY01001880.1:90-548(-)
MALRPLTEEERAEFKEMFDLVDIDKGGTISKDELFELMISLGLNPTKEYIDAMVKEIDADGSGDIDFEEFVTVMRKKMQPSHSQEVVKKAFKFFENKNHPGKVDVDMLETILKTVQGGSNGESARELFSLVEVDENGWCDFENFVDLIYQGQ